MAKLESKIQSDIMLFLKGNRKAGEKGIGGWWLNFHGGDVFMPRGIPDIIGCYHGRFVAFEVKRLGEEPRPIQISTIKKLKEVGAIAGVVYSVEDVKELLNSHNEKIS